MGKDQRPVPLPSRAPATPAAAAATGTPAPPVKRPLPAGATKWARVYLDHRNMPVESSYPVPVDENDRRTHHVRHTCRGFITLAGVRTPCDQVAWLEPGAKARFCPDHGCELTAEATPRTPLLPWPAMWQAVAPKARTAPFLLTEVALGAAEQVGHVPVGVPSIATVATTASGYVVVRWRLTARAVKAGKLDKGQRTGRRMDTIRRRARVGAYMGLAAGSWLTAAATVDPGTWVGKTILASVLPLWALASATWWRYQDRQNNRPEQPEETPTPDEATTPDADQAGAQECAARWDSDAGFPNTALDVATWQRTPFGWQAVVTATKRGALNSLGGENTRATVKKIAAAYDVPRSAVTWIEEHDDNPNLGRVLVQPSNPLKEGEIWGGADLIQIRDSRITADVGRLIDGTRMIETLFRFEEGMPSELVLGTTGSGKSERLRLSLVVQRWASFPDPTTGQRKGLFLSFLHDPKRLNSYGEFRNAVHGYGITRDDAHLMVDAFLREMVRRYDMLRTLKWTDAKGRRRVGSVKWNPLIHGPLLKVIWDEFHELTADKEFVAKLEKLARYQRACGMGSTLASHMGTIGDTGTQALRDMLSGGRASLLRTTSGLNAALATGGQLTGDPRALPKQPGMVLVADGETATLTGRYSFIPDDRLATKLGVRPLYDWLFDDDNGPIGFPALIPPETAEAFGREFMEWMEAGRSEAGRVDVPGGSPSVVAPASDLRAEEVLRQILFRAGGALGRQQIAEHPEWRFGVTSTLTKALRAGQDAHPPWLIKVKNGAYDLTLPMRQQMQAAAEEEKETAAA